MTTRDKILTVAFVVFACGVIALVIYGVTTHTEPGLSAQSNAWASVPLSVSCASYGPDDPGEACSVVRAAIAMVNTRLGFTMLVLSGGAEADVNVTMRAPVEVGHDEPGGAYDLIGRGDVYTNCEVRIMNVSAAGDLELLTVYHELGHCLGLAHDEYETSIMRPIQSPTPTGAIPPWISDWDRELLRGKYQ